MISPILEASAEILQNILVDFWVMEFEEKLLLRFPDLYYYYREKNEIRASCYEEETEKDVIK